MAIGIVNAILSLAWLPYVLFEFDLFSLFGGTEITVMLVTVLAAVAAFDIFAKAGVVCYPSF